MAISSLPHLDHTEPVDNMGGLQVTAYYALVSEFDTDGINTPLGFTDATGLSNLSTISAEHTFLAGKGWKRCYVTEDTAGVECTQQGELDGKSWLNKFTGFHPGNSAQIMGLVRYLNNAGAIFIGVDAEGLQRQVGSKQWPGHLVDGSVTTTTTAAGRKGCTFSIQCSSPYPAPIYPFDLDLESSSS